MADSTSEPLSSDSALVRAWRRIPLVIRAVVVGFVVNTIGVGAWVLCSVVVPTPWSIAVMAVLLWLYWRYFSGSWWPTSTQAARREGFRSVRLPGAVWKWSLVGAALFVVLVQSAMVVTFRFTEYPEALFKAEYAVLGDAPVWIAWLLVFMAALVAGICEETGFRGYMQVPLETRYGPIVSITIVSIVFVAAHLHQAWAGPVVFHIFAASAALCALAYASGSLIPGIIAHTIMDVFNFSYWWSDLAGKFERRPITETGLDAHAFMWILIFVAALVMFLWTIRKLLAIRSREGSTTIA